MRLDPAAGPLASAEVLGVKVTSWRAESLIEALIDWAKSGESVTVAYANPHVLNVAEDHEDVRAFLNDATTVYVDGTGVRLAAGILGTPLPERTTAADWLDAWCDRAVAAGVAMYFLAGADGVAEQAAQKLTGRHPGLLVAGTHHGYIGEESSPAVIRAINSSGADVVLVGMGTPEQERWIARYRADVRSPVVWAVGAVLDFVTGVQQRAPSWVSNNHLEWLWRLASDPRRLGRRYLLGNPRFLGRVLRQRFRQRGPA